MRGGGSVRYNPLPKRAFFSPPQHSLLSWHQPQELLAHQEQLGPGMGHALEPLHQVPDHLGREERVTACAQGVSPCPHTPAGGVTLTRTEKSERQPGARLR